MCCKWWDYHTHTSRKTFLRGRLCWQLATALELEGQEKIKKRQKRNSRPFSPARSNKRGFRQRQQTSVGFQPVCVWEGKVCGPSNTRVSLMLQGAGRLIGSPLGWEATWSKQTRFCCEQQQTAAKISAGNGNVSMLCQFFFLFFSFAMLQQTRSILYRLLLNRRHYNEGHADTCLGILKKEEVNVRKVPFD